MAGLSGVRDVDGSSGYAHASTRAELAVLAPHRPGAVVQPKLKIGFIGGGLNSAVGRTHAVATQMDGRFELVAGVFSTHDEVNAATGDRWGVDAARVYGTWHDMLEAEAGLLDAIVVLTPTPLHVEHVDAALRAGFNVICEKSLSESSATSGELNRLAEAEGRFLAVTYNYSGYPMMRELRSRIERLELGRVLSIHVEMPQETFLRRDAKGEPVRPQAWRQRDGATPTVSLDLGTHTHHLVQFLLGTEPLELVATQAHHGRIASVADYVNCIAKYPDDIDVSMWFGKSSIGNRNGLRLRIYGDAGAAEWLQTNPEELAFADDRGTIRTIDRSSPGSSVAAQPRYERFKAGHPAGFLEAFGNLYVDIADALAEFTSGATWSSGFVASALDDARGLRMMEAIAESSLRRQWVTVGQV